VDLDEPVDQNSAHLGVDVVLTAHVGRIDRTFVLGGEAVLVDVGRVLGDLLGIGPDWLVHWVYLAFEEVSSLELGMEVGESLFYSKLLLKMRLLNALEKRQGRDSRRFLHAAAVILGRLHV